MDIGMRIKELLWLYSLIHRIPSLLSNGKSFSNPNGKKCQENSLQASLKVHNFSRQASNAPFRKELCFTTYLPKGSVLSIYKILRAGSWVNEPQIISSTDRTRLDPLCIHTYLAVKYIHVIASSYFMIINIEVF